MNLKDLEILDKIVKTRLALNKLADVLHPDKAEEVLGASAMLREWGKEILAEDKKKDKKEDDKC